MPIDRPGSYLRHAGYVYSLNANDGSTLFGQDATFCPVLSVSTTSPVISLQDGPVSSVYFRSINFNTRYFRVLDSGLYLAVANGGQSGDAADNYAQDIIWNVTAPFATE
jgi:hypothetical protein